MGPHVDFTNSIDSKFAKEICNKMTLNTSLQIIIFFKLTKKKIFLYIGPNLQNREIKP
jgi:hypothetical protein